MTTKLMFHYQQYVPAMIQLQTEQLLGCVLDYGPHATKRWRQKFGSISKPLQLPLDAQFLEISVKVTSSSVRLDTVLFRFDCDDTTDVILSVVASTKFVCSAWRVPKWFGKAAGRPKDPKKYLTQAQYKQLLKGVMNAA
jgi:hypothetical protein